MRGHRRHDWLWAAGMLAPGLLLFAVFVVAPTVSTFALTFMRWNLITPAHYAGAANYHTLVDDPRLPTILLNTVLFAVVSVALKLALGLGLAALVWSIRLRPVTPFLESALFFPVILPLAVVALVWGLLFNTDLGAVNGFLGSVGLGRVPWFTDPHVALFSLVLLDVWKGVGFFFVVYLVALRNISRELLEAAHLDGAGFAQRFRYVVVPLVSPTTLFLTVTGTIGSLQVFDQSYLLTRGGPGDSTRTIVYYIWELAFQRLNAGYAATVALLLFGFIVILTAVLFRLSRRFVHYGA